MNDLSDLNAILSREIQHKDKRTELAAVRREPITPDQAARILVLEEALDWHPVSQHLLLAAYECHCGSTDSRPAGLLVRQNHRRDPIARRWVRVSALRSDLPVGPPIAEPYLVPACPSCLSPLGAVALTFSPFPDVLGAYNGTSPTPSPDRTQDNSGRHDPGPDRSDAVQPDPRASTSWGLQPFLREPLARLLLPAAGRKQPAHGV